MGDRGPQRTRLRDLLNHITTNLSVREVDPAVQRQLDEIVKLAQTAREENRVYPNVLADLIDKMQNASDLIVDRSIDQQIIKANTNINYKHDFSL